MGRTLRVIMGCALAWGLAAPAHADLYRLEVTGVLASNSAPSGYGMDRYAPLGSPVSFVSLIDTSVGGASCPPFGGQTYPAVTNIQLTVGGLRWGGTQPGYLEVDTLSCNAHPAPVDNVVLFVLGGMVLDSPTNEPLLALLPIFQIYMPFFGTPPAPRGLLPDPFTGTVGAFTIAWGGGGASVTSLQTSITAVPDAVPAPAVGVVWLLGLIATRAWARPGVRRRR